MIKSAIFSNRPDQINYVFQSARLEHIGQLTTLYPEIISENNFAKQISEIKDVDVVFSTWGMPVFSKDQIAQLPNLKALFYAAGTVKKFGQPYLSQGVKIFSAWRANGIAVAEFTVGQILLSGKRYFQNCRDCREPELRELGNSHLPTGLGVYGETVALIGCGVVARNVIRMLKTFDMKVLVVDPYLPDADAAFLEVEKVSLEEAFKMAYIISNHLPDTPSIEGLINGKLFASMRLGSTFINTGRGRQVIEAEMIEVLERRTDITALLDVTFPEPPLHNSPLYTLKNVFMTSHIAGSMGNEVVRMADAMLKEFERWRDGLPPTCEITQSMLEIIG